MKPIYAFLFLLVNFFSETIHGQDIRIDSSYAVNGISIIPGIHISNSVGRVATAIQPDGKIVQASNVITTTPGNPGTVIIRLNENGFPDPGFGDNGVKNIQATPFLEQPTAVCIQPDGKILVGGLGVESNNEIAFVLIRLLDNGDPDPSFGGGDGIVVSNFVQGKNESMQNMYLQQDGKILTCGYTFETNSQMIVARYDRHGNPDTTFNHTGYLFQSFSSTSYLAANCITEEAGGKIIVGGVYKEVSTSNSYLSVLFRLNSNGTPDLSYGVGGMASSDASESFVDLKWDHNKLYAAGFRSVSRFLPGGIADNTFGLSGTLIPPAANILFRSVIIRPDESLFMTGTTDNDFILLKIKPGGHIDSSFGTNGYLFIPIGMFKDRSYSVHQRSNKIYLGGSTESVLNGSRLFAAIRLSYISGETRCRLFPNPTAGRLYLDCDRPYRSVVLFNVLGQQLLSWNNNPGSIDIQQLPSGTYFLVIEHSSGRTSTDKIVKE